MYKSNSKMHSYNSLTPHRSPSPVNATTKPIKQPCYNSPKIDLRQFNDYLQQRISRSALKKEFQMSRRESSQQRLSRQPSRPQITPTPTHLKPPGFQNSKESRVIKSRQALSPLNGWRKHQSIQSLVDKQNKLTFCQNRRTQSQSQDSILRDLQRKYQQLQQKYKNLMKEASENARDFQKDKQQLQKMKEVHQDDQTTLTKLRKELSQMHQNMKNQEDYQNNQNSLSKVKSEINLGSSYSPFKDSQPTHDAWKSKLFQESKIPSNNMRMSRSHKTQENWTKKLEKSRMCQSGEKIRPDKSRYYSAEKVIDSMRKSKVKKISNHTQYPNTQSKTSIKFIDSTANSRVKAANNNTGNSRVKIPNKPATETLIRFDNEFSKNTPTTLHKKVLPSKPYSKYRFQPTFKMQ